VTELTFFFVYIQDQTIKHFLINFSFTLTYMKSANNFHFSAS